MTVHREKVRVDLLQDKPRGPRMVGGKRVGISRTLTPEVKDWIKTSVLEHWYLYEVSGVLWIAFHSHRDAMLYKLAWH